MFDIKKMKQMLLPTDFSEGAQRSLEVARQLALRFGLTIHLVHVDEERALGMHGSDDLIHFMNDVDARRKEWMEDMAAQLGDAGIDVVLVRLEGVASEEILGYAERESIELIAMGTVGHTTVKEMLLGSTIRAVLREATCHVLTVNARWMSEDPWTVGKVLFPTDFSDTALAGVAVAGGLARAWEAELGLLHVLRVPTYIPSIPGEPPFYLSLEAFETSHLRANKQLMEIKDVAVLGGLDVTTDVTLSGDAAEGIVSYATDNGCQLLVIPRHGRGGLRSFFFGRVVDQVVKRSPYPVLSFVPAVTE
jgi:nucleotide-binding universal stress UspA family protein